MSSASPTSSRSDRSRRKERGVPTQAKMQEVESLKARLAGVKTAVLTEYRGLTVQQLSDLRKQLRTVAAEYKVLKNRLARRALQGAPPGGLGPPPKGPAGGGRGGCEGGGGRGGGRGRGGGGGRSGGRPGAPRRLRRRRRRRNST